jgi:hypothetical protein
VIGDQHAHLRLGHRANHGIAIPQKSFVQRKAVLSLPAVSMIVLTSVLLVRPVSAQEPGTLPSVPEPLGPWSNPSAGNPATTASNTIWEGPSAAFDGGQLPGAAGAPQVEPFSGPPLGNRREPVASGEEGWAWHALPDNIIYPSYLAGVKEPRLATTVNYDKDIGWTWDSALGVRVGLLRYGTEGTERPDGYELGIEGAAFPRLDLEHDRDLVSVDFRFGVPLTFGCGRFQSKLAFYHACSHLGDQYMLLYPDLARTDYSRDAIVWGNSYYLTDDLRLYGEVSWGFYVWGAARPWEFQFGVEYSATQCDGVCGSPFAAVNADLREDVDYGGNLVVQAGWQWRSPTGHLFRVGVQYFNGKSEQFQFLNRNEEKIGIAIWYDF